MLFSRISPGGLFLRSMVFGPSQLVLSVRQAFVRAEGGRNLCVAAGDYKNICVKANSEIEQPYKCKGSVVMWVLAHGLEDAFTVWMLCQKRDREYHNGIPSGYIDDPGILKYLAHSFKSSREKARKALGVALRYGFLTPADRPGAYYICSQRKLVFRAMDDQKKRCEEDNSLIPPKVYLKGDVEFTRKFENWVCPTDMTKTKALLYGVMAVQGSPICRGRDNHGRLIEHHRRTVQRYSKNAGIQEQERYLLFDVMRMLIDPACSIKDAVKAFQEAEFIYRKMGHAPIGRQLFHRKTVELATSDLKTFLTVQLPNAYSSKLNLNTAPSRQGSAWLNSESGGTGCQNTHVDSHRALVSGLLRGETNKKGSVPDVVPDRVMAHYISQLSDILEVDECRDVILRKTGARGLRSIRSSRPQAWRLKSVHSSATPFLAKHNYLTREATL